MIARLIDWCTSNRFLVCTGTAVLTLWGLWSMTVTPLDAVPDISDVQVIVSTEWIGRSPDLIEDQITYPLVSASISTPRVRTVRSFYRFRGLVCLRHLRRWDRHVLGAEPAIKASNNDVEGRLLGFAGREYMVRGRGYLTSVDDIAEVSLGADARGTPIRVADVAQVRLGPDIRRGVAELDGVGEVVGGIVIVRYGENALDVINRVKEKLREVEDSLPPGVVVVPTYDRSGLIEASIGTLSRTLIEEAVVVSLVIIIFLFHVRSALIPILTLPIAVVAAFIPMYCLGVSSNIMSLGGIALAIGVLVDASIVMVENAYGHVSEADVPYEDQPRVILAAASTAGPVGRGSDPSPAGPRQAAASVPRGGACLRDRRPGDDFDRQLADGWSTPRSR